MATLAPGGRHLVSLEEFEELYSSKIENILGQQTFDDIDRDMVDSLCLSICLTQMGINLGEWQDGFKPVLMFNPDTCRLEVCYAG